MCVGECGACVYCIYVHMYVCVIHTSTYVSLYVVYVRLCMCMYVRMCVGMSRNMQAAAEERGHS